MAPGQLAPSQRKNRMNGEKTKGINKKTFILVYLSANVLLPARLGVRSRMSGPVGILEMGRMRRGSRGKSGACFLEGRSALLRGPICSPTPASAVDEQWQGLRKRSLTWAIQPQLLRNIQKADPSSSKGMISSGDTSFAPGPRCLSAMSYFPAFATR